MHILKVLCIAIVILINFSSFVDLYLFCLKTCSFAQENLQQQPKYISRLQVSFLTFYKQLLNKGGGAQKALESL